LFFEIIETQKKEMILMRSFENGRKMGGQKLFSRLFDILLDEKGGGERINI